MGYELKKILKPLIRFLFANPIIQGAIKQLIFFLSRLANLNLLLVAYNRIGILNYSNSKVSGEDYVVSEVLKKYFKTSSPVMFDVGANIGAYSQKLNKAYPMAKIYAFEPNENSFSTLKTNLQNSEVSCYNLGLSSISKKEIIYTHNNELSSEHASFYKGVFLDIHHNPDISELEVEVTTLEEFCQHHNIVKIDFLKIDTEGHEYEVLKGGMQFIAQNKIDLIQFEFNEMNVLSRVFLKDFYDLLAEYKIFRINTNQLIPLFNYDSFYEIFKFQNFLAINKNIYEQQ